MYWNKDIPTDKMEAKHAVIIERYQASRDTRYVFERLWYMACAFYLNAQWVQFHTTTGILREPPRRRNEIRETVNLITPMVNDRIAKMVRAESVPSAIPAKDTESAKRKAYLASAWLQYIRRRAEWPEIKRWLYTWLFTTGNAFLWIGWDSRLGRGFKDTLDGREIEIFEGDVFFEADGPFSTYIDPAAYDVRDAQWIMRVRRVNTELLRERFPSFKDEIQPDDYTGDYSQFFVEALRSQASSAVYWNQPRAKATTLFEYYEKASKKHPRGRRVLMAGTSAILADTENPYHWLKHQFPVIHYREIYTPPRFWASSTTERALPVQRSINSIYSRIREHLNLQIYPRIAIHKGSQIVKSAFTNQPGEKLYYTGIAPTLLQAATVSSDAWKMLESKLQLFRQITGWLEISQGSVPPGVTSGVALQILAEQNAGPLVTVSRSIADADALSAEYALAIATRKYKEPRALQIIGDANSVHEVWLDPQELRPEDVGDEFVLHMTPGMEVTETKAGREAKVIELINRQVLDMKNPMDREMARKMLDLATVADAFTHNRLDREKADRENRTMADRRYPTADWFDNHLIHIDQHTRFMKSREYENLDEETKIVFVAHTQTHFGMAGIPIPGAPMPGSPEAAMQGPQAGAVEGQPGEGQAPPGAEAPGEEPAFPEPVPPGGPEEEGVGAALPAFEA